MYQMVRRYGIEKFLFVALDERAAAAACQLNGEKKRVIMHAIHQDILSLIFTSYHTPILQRYTHQEKKSSIYIYAKQTAPVVLLDEVSYPALRKHAQDKSQETKAQVEEAKFGTSAKLAGMYVDAFFLEMDCWMLKNPLPLFTAVRVKADYEAPRPKTSSYLIVENNQNDGKTNVYVKPDIVISVHQVLC
jgi:hypothetical protein